MFLHDTGGFSHILFNMLALWMFGTELERLWCRVLRRLPPSLLSLPRMKRPWMKKKRRPKRLRSTDGRLSNLV